MMRRRFIQLRMQRTAAVVVITVSLLAPQPAFAQRMFLLPLEHAVVLRGFDPPNVAWGRGHRGVDLAAREGALIRAAADGIVTFAGTVAAHSWVSIAHPDGHLSSYGPLTALRVGVGDTLAAGTVIGQLASGGHGPNNSDQGLHFSLRFDGEYRDPFSVLPRAGFVTLVGESMWMAGGAPLRATGKWGGGRFGGMLVQGSAKATMPYAFYPPNANHLVVVSGLATSSDSGMPDPVLLGYSQDSVTRFSYAGLEQSYGPEHTWDGPLAYVGLFEETLRDIARRQPGRAVDLVVHSQAGLFALAYAVTRDPFDDPSLPPIGNIIFMGVPIDGSDLAAIGVLLREELGLAVAMDALQQNTGLGMGTLPLDVPAIRDLDPRSAATKEIAQLWHQAWHEGLGEVARGPLRLPPNVLSIAGATDFVVAPGRTRIARRSLPEKAKTYLHERVLPGGHGSMKHTEAAHEMIWQFLAGEELVVSPGYLATGLGKAFGGVVEVARFVVNDLLLPPQTNTTGCFGFNRLLSQC